MAIDSKVSPELEIPIYIWKPAKCDAKSQDSPPPFESDRVIEPPIGTLPDDFCLNDLIFSVDQPPRRGKWEPKKNVDAPKNRYEHHDEPGHQDKDRVAELFKFIVAKFAVFMAQFNEAYKIWSSNPNQATALYNETSQAYLQFVNDLDNRHAHDERPGFGRPIKWVDVLPDIRTDRADWATEGPIKGLQVVVKWNPCSSTHRGSYSPSAN